MKRIVSLVMIVSIIFSFSIFAYAEEGRKTNDNIFNADAVISTYDVDDGDEHGSVLVVKNNSKFSIAIEVYAAFYDGEDNLVYVDSSSSRLVESGYSTVMAVSSYTEYERVEYGFQVAETRYVPLRSNFTYEDSASTDAVKLSVTNNNEVAASDVSATVLFFSGDDLVYLRTERIKDDTDGIQAGGTGEVEVKSYSPFDSYEVYLSAYTSK